MADLVHAVARQLVVPADLRPGPCTPVEISVVRFICRNPGTSARTAAAATMLPSSNFSRVIKGLIAKGLLVRQADDQDARVVRLYPTALAETNMLRMRQLWSQSLVDASLTPETIAVVNAALRRIEFGLVAQSQGPAARGGSAQVPDLDGTEIKRIKQDAL
nr:MarR family winged helix-turn-helix transcriptional regulator [Devosia sp. 919]